MEKGIKSNVTISHNDINQFHQGLAKEIYSMQAKGLTVEILFSTTSTKDKIVYSAIILGRG